MAKYFGFELASLGKDRSRVIFTFTLHDNFGSEKIVQMDLEPR